MAVDTKMTKDEKEIVKKAMGAYRMSLMRSVTKEGESDIGKIYQKRVAELDALAMRMTQQSLDI